MHVQYYSRKVAHAYHSYAVNYFFFVFFNKVNILAIKVVSEVSDMVILQHSYVEK